MIKEKNVTLLNVTYIKYNKFLNQKECFRVIYKTEDGEIKFSDEPPLADIFIVKPEYRNYQYTKPQERIDHMDKITCNVSEIQKVIAKHSGEWGENILRQAYVQNDYKLRNQIYRWPYAYGCDFQPEFYFYRRWFQEHEIGMPKLSKAFLDIELDLIDYQVDLSDLKNTAHAPVNLISVVLQETKEAFMFVLRPYKPPMNSSQERIDMYNKQIKDHNYMISHLDEFYDDLRKRFDPVYPGFRYQLREYVQEIDLITDMFRLINKRKPNFCGIWNMRFDIQYLYYRILQLGYEPSTIMNHSDFPNGTCYFKEDKSTFQLEKQYDYFYCSSYTQYLCQMRLYGSIRKSQHKSRSLRLNYVSDMVLRDKKVDYPENANIKTFTYMDWPMFIRYNLKDSLLLYGIENKTNDMMTYYMRSMANMTTFSKIFKETTLLRNVREMYFEKEGWVQSNNLNILNDNKKDDSGFYGSEEDEDDGQVSFKGAIVGDPSYNDYVGKPVMGMKSNNVFTNCIDFDMGAFYPSTKIICNMDASTLIYKASFDNYDFISGEFSNKSLNQTYEEIDKNGNTRKIDFTGEAVNMYIGGNELSFGYAYLNIPSISKIYDLVKERVQRG